MTITKQDLIELGCEPEHAEDWLTVRKAKRKPLTQTALKRMITEAHKAGLTLPEVVKMCAEEGWQGFKASYVPSFTANNVEPKTEKQKVREAMRNIHDTDW